MKSRALLAAWYGAFCAAYFGLFALGGPQWSADALLVIPAGVAAALHFRRASRETGRARWFWRLTGLGPALWALGTALWALAEYQGYHPGATASSAEARGFPILLDALFVAFYVPIACAVATRPHPRAHRPDRVALAEIGLIVAAVAFVFLRLVFVPAVAAVERPWRLVFGLLSLVLAGWSAAFWRWVDDLVWKRTYGLLSVFALLYVFLESLVTGFGTTALAPGGPADLAWILPFFVLALAALPLPLRYRVPATSTRLVLLAGAGPLMLEAGLRVLSPLLGVAYESHLTLLVGASAALALGLALRLRLEQRRDARRLADAGGRAEEARRADRLGTLASLTSSLVQELQVAAGDVVRNAEEAAPFMGDKAERVLEQARRAETIVTDLAASLRLAPKATRQEVDLGRVLEEAVRAALDEGLALHVGLEGTRRLPPVWGDPRALGSAFQHLIRNASQASPGGHLRRGNPGRRPGSGRAAAHRLAGRRLRRHGALGRPGRPVPSRGAGLGASFPDPDRDGHGGPSRRRRRASGAAPALGPAFVTCGGRFSRRTPFRFALASAARRPDRHVRGQRAPVGDQGPRTPGAGPVRRVPSDPRRRRAPQEPG